MFVIVDLTVPAAEFPLGRGLTSSPAIEFEFERIVPVSDGVVPLVWVTFDDELPAEQPVFDASTISSARELTRVGSRVLYELHWRRRTTGILSALAETNGRLLSAEGDECAWRFRVQFDDHDGLSRLHQTLRAASIEFSLERVYNPTAPRNDRSLSAKQYEALAVAYRRGYWSVPRRTTTTQLAEDLGISDQAVSQRLRRGVESLVASVLQDE